MANHTNEMAAFLDTGLDTASDELTTEEAAAFLEWNQRMHGSDDTDLVSFSRFLVQHDPVGLKRLRRHIMTIDSPSEGDGLPIGAAVLMWAFSYCVLGNKEGTLYEVIAARELGASKREVVDLFRLAGYVGGPLALNAAAALTADYLDAWTPTEHEGLPWPDGWNPDPRAFASGIDPATNELTATELGRISAWYRRVYGESPAHIAVVARWHATALKTMRLRYEAAMSSTSLPARLLPLLLLHVEALRGRELPAQRAARLARHLGCEPQQVLGTILWASVYGGDAVLEPAVRAIGDVLDE